MPKSSKIIALKIFSFFSVIRGYNLLVLVVAQYLASIYILEPNKRALDVLLDWRLFVLVAASSFAIASGYIINNFYDSKKDLINRPKKTMIDRFVSQKTQLQVYFTLNFFSALLGLMISWRAGLFFSVYIFILWFYSHKLKKYPIIGNITASLLAVLPFFGILLYFKNFYEVIFAHASFLYLIILIREIIKDFENIEGDLTNNYQTIPVRFGSNFGKYIITALVLLTLIPVYFLLNIYDIGYMDVYFYISYILLLIFCIKLWNSNEKLDFLKLHLLLKFILIAGVISIVLIKPSIIESGQKLLSVI